MGRTEELTFSHGNLSYHSFSFISTSETCGYCQFLRLRCVLDTVLSPRGIKVAIPFLTSNNIAIKEAICAFSAISILVH